VKVAAGMKLEAEVETMAKQSSVFARPVRCFAIFFFTALSMAAIPLFISHAPRPTSWSPAFRSENASLFHFLLLFRLYIHFVFLGIFYHLKEILYNIERETYFSQ
jgi:hypothetical protein